MRVIFSAFLTLAFSVVPALAQDSSAIREWIEDLGHDKIEIRTTAGLNLLKEGRAVVHKRSTNRLNRPGYSGGLFS